MNDLTVKDAKILLSAARAQHRALTRMREDMVRLDVLNHSVVDGLIDQQNDLVEVIEKLQVIVGEIPA